MDSDDPIENSIGRFGKYQIMVWALITIGRLPTDFQLTNVVFLIPNEDYICLDDPTANSTNMCPCQNPQYDQSIMTSSVSSTWDLICERRSLGSLAQSILQVGILMGSLMYGHISDRYGRKLAVTSALFLEAVSVALSAFATELWMFIALRCLIGISLGGTMLCCFVLLAELSGKSFLPYLMGIHEVSYISAYFSLPIIAYYVQDWRHLQLVTSVPWLLTLAYFWIIPESPRWLITIGKKDEAIAVLTYIAKKNNLPTDKIAAIVNQLEKSTIAESTTNRGSYLDLFKTPKLHMYTLITALIWLCTAFVFFGVNQYIGRLQGNIYINVMLSALSLAPGLILVVIATLFLNRKTGVITSFAIAGLSLILFIFVPNYMGAVTLTFAVIGQMGAYTAFVQVYLYSSEVFPTIIRNSAMGFASVFGRVGGFVAPFIVDIGVEWISILLFSALALLAGFLCYMLPETKGKVLPNTIKDTENRSKSVSGLSVTQAISQSM